MVKPKQTSESPKDLVIESRLTYTLVPSSYSGLKGEPCNMFVFFFFFFKSKIKVFFPYVTVSAGLYFVLNILFIFFREGERESE